MKINITHTDAKILILEIWQNEPETELVDSQETEAGEESDDIEIELQTGQYVVVRGLE